ELERVLGARGLLHALAYDAWTLAARDVGDRDPLGAGPAPEVVPLDEARVEHLAAHARAVVGVREALDRRLGAARMGPRGEDRSEHGRARGVGILIAGHDDTRALRRLDAILYLAPAREVLLARDLPVGDVHSAPALATDLDHLVDRLEDPVALAPQVDDE